MPRPLVVGNGNLLVTFDAELNIRDFYWPFVGLYNHLSGHRARVGVWVDGWFSWLSDRGWERTLGYEKDTLVTDVTAKHPAVHLTVHIKDCVSHRADVLLRRFRITNHASSTRELRLFLSHDFLIAETDIGDTAFYNPFLDAIIHYKRNHYILIAARTQEAGLYQYATGIKGFQGAEGTWRDAEDGTLSMNAVAQGSVDSTLSVRARLLPASTTEVRAWLCVGQNLEEVALQHRRVEAQDVETLQNQTARYWRAWSNGEAERVALLPEPIPSIFRRSLLILRTNIDNRGAIIAANDSDILETARAHYSYMWPRDGALVAATLDRLGYQNLTQRFFQFCKNILPHDRPVLLHKYSADGSWGATWHPWTVEGYHEVPFQEDSTALVLWALWQHYRRHRNLEFIMSMYDDFVVRCADFITEYRDASTGLPRPSYDLWEERRGVHTYTCGTVYGALTAAAGLSEVIGDEDRSAKYRAAAEEVREGMARILWDEETGRFARRLIPQTPDSSNYSRDLTIDSSLYAVFAFGAFSPNDPRVASTMRAVLTRLWVRTEVGGIARYERDYYFRRSDDFDRIPGNPWIICTLWAAQWYIVHARTTQELTTGLDLLLWAAHRTLPGGVMPEQLHPETGVPLSVAPLTWSHAEFISTTLQYLDQQEQLTARKKK